jgi:hypothetical protein
MRAMALIMEAASTSRRWSVSARLYDATSQKTAMFILGDVRTSIFILFETDDADGG